MNALAVTDRLLVRRRLSHPSKHWTLEPRAIVLADRSPRNAHVAVGVAAVEFITVIEPNRSLVGGSNRRTPFPDFLAAARGGKTLGRDRKEVRPRYLLIGCIEAGTHCCEPQQNDWFPDSKC